MSKTKKSATKSINVEKVLVKTLAEEYTILYDKYMELVEASKTYMESSEDYTEDLEEKLYDLSSDAFELKERAESAEAMLVDVKQQLEYGREELRSMTESRNYYLDLSEERWANLEKAYAERDYWHKCWKQVYGHFIETQKGWCERFLDWLEHPWRKK